MPLEKIRFQTNKPVELALKWVDGKLCDSQFGDPQYLFTTTDDRVFFVAEKVAQKIHGLRLAPGELIDVCKAEVDFGRGRKGVEWQISRVGTAPVGEQANGTFIVPAAPASTAKPEPVAPPAAAAQPSNGNGSNKSAQLSAVSTQPASAPRTKLEDALKTVIAAVIACEGYAAHVGFAMPTDLSWEDLRTMANTLIMQNGNGGPRVQ